MDTHQYLHEHFGIIIIIQSKKKKLKLFHILIRLFNMATLSLTRW